MIFFIVIEFLTTASDNLSPAERLLRWSRRHLTRRGRALAKRLEGVRP